MGSDEFHLVTEAAGNDSLNTGNTIRSSRLATVVIPVLNAQDSLAALLNALDKQTIRHKISVLVVDNGSSDDSVEIALGHADLTLSVTRRGIRFARQAGLDCVQSPFILSIDSDCVPAHSDWAERLVDGILNSDADVMGATGPVEPFPCSDKWALRDDVTPQAGRDALGKVTYPVGCNNVLRVSSLRKLGGYQRVGRLVDDAAIGSLALANGYRFDWNPQALVLHRNQRGWRGYANQMYKVGGYSAGFAQRPKSLIEYAVYHSLRAAKCSSRELSHGHLFEASAQAVKIISMLRGAVKEFRSIPKQMSD